MRVYMVQALSFVCARVSTEYIARAHAFVLEPQAPSAVPSFDDSLGDRTSRMQLASESLGHLLQSSDPRLPPLGGAPPRKPESRCPLEGEFASFESVDLHAEIKGDPFEDGATRTPRRAPPP